MNRTDKYIVAFLLVNLALAGALHFLPPVKPVSRVVDVPPPAHVVEDKNLTSTASINGISKRVDPVEMPLPEQPSNDLRVWARQNPQAALNCAAQQPPGDDRDEILSAACFQIAEADPACAVATAEKFCATNGGLLCNLAQQWAQKDLSAAREWVKAKEIGAEREELVERIGLVWAATEPQSAAQFVVDEIPPGPQQTEAAITILHQWTSQDFNAAAAWAGQFPEGPIRDRALKELDGIQSIRQAMATQASP